MHADHRPVIVLETVRGRLPSAACAASNIQLQTALQHAAHTVDAVQPVPLDRWDANWPAAGNRKQVGCASSLDMIHCELSECSLLLPNVPLTRSSLTHSALFLLQGSQPRRTLRGVCGGLGTLRCRGLQHNAGRGRCHGSPAARPA